MVGIGALAMLGMPAWYIHMTGLVLLVSRIVHAFGLASSSGMSAGRIVGTVGTLLVYLAVAGASVFGEYLTFEQIPDKIANAVVANLSSPWAFLLAVNILLLVIGMFMDIISATLILTPIFLPLLSKFGISTLHFGLLMTLNLGIGYCTPPLGVSLYISGAVVDRGLLYVSRAVLPFLLIQVALLLLLTYWPGLVLILPRLFYGVGG
jgi:C4-dicarboxylate transporter DctM subunit